MMETPMYTAPLYIGSSHEGSSQMMNYYLVQAYDPASLPTLLLTTYAETEKFCGIQVAARELEFLKQLGIRANIARAIEAIG